MKLKEIANISTGYSFRSKVRHDPEGDTKVIQMRNIDECEGIMIEDLRMIANFNPRNDRYFLDEGDIIMTNKGYNLKAYLIPEGIGKVVAANSFIVLKAASTKVIPEYLVWFLNAKYMQHFLKAISAGTHTPSLSKRALEAVEISLPPVEKQQVLCEIERLKRKEIIYRKKIASKKEQYINAVLQRKNEEWISNN
jgi:restriction endonuclease S subunit